jgi:rhodanese-related sulfurtransferase
VARRLQKLGFANVFVLKGGLKAWYDHVRERRADSGER